MKKLLLSASLLLATSSAAIAGSMDAPEVSTGTDWSGFYVGGNLSSAKGTITNIALTSDSLAATQTAGIFAGYNVQRDNLVFGGELDFALSPTEFEVFSATMEDAVDAKARVGYAFDTAMVYGVVGYSTMTLDDLPELADLSGFSYGVGVDVKFSDRFFVGLEYLTRSVSGAFDSNPANAFEDQDVQTIKVRAGISF